MIFLVNLVHILIQFYTLLVIVKVVISYFMSPYNPVREAIDRLVDPVLEPIRRNVPAIGMFDFSPVILIILLQIIDTLIPRY